MPNLKKCVDGISVCLFTFRKCYHETGRKYIWRAKAELFFLPASIDSPPGLPVRMARPESSHE